jgi:outer membrane protein TolC
MKIFLFLSALLFAIPLWVEADEIMTLKDFLARVEKNNPEILAGERGVKAKEAMRKAAGAWEDPMAVFGVGRHPTTYVAPGSSSILVEDALFGKHFELSQKLPFFGTLRQRKKIAGQEKREAEFGWKQTKLDRLAEAKKAYYDWSRARKDQELLERAYFTWEKLVSFTQTRYAQAGGLHNEYLRAQVELKKVESEKLENREMLRKAEAAIAYLLGDSAAFSGFFPEPLPEDLRPVPAADSAYRLALAQSPELGMINAFEQKAHFEKNLAAKNYWPDFEAGFYVEQEVDHFFGDRLMTITGGRIGLRLPVFFWTTGRREVQAKGLEIERARFLRKNMENQKRAEVAMFSAEIERLEKQVRLYKDELLPRAGLLVEESRTAYSVGRLSFPDFSEAQLEVIELERKYAALLADYWKAKAELDKTVGIN